MWFEICSGFVGFIVAWTQILLFALYNYYKVLLETVRYRTSSTMTGGSVVGPLTVIPTARALVLCALVVWCSTIVTGWRYYDARPVARRFPQPMSTEDEEDVGFIKPISNDHYLDQVARLNPRPEGNDLLQHELWDKKKMADDDDDDDFIAAVSEARKWSNLQDKIAENYIRRTLNYLLNGDRDFMMGKDNGGVEAEDVDRREGGFRNDDDRIEVERRAGLPGTCGFRPHESGVFKRVVEGHETRIGWPWLVQFSLIDAKQPYCGGTLLSREFVLTAAHCFDRHEPNDVIVIVGDRDRSEKEGTELRFRIECVYVHEAYIPQGDYKDDVALVRLKITSKKMVRMGPAVQPACLPPNQREGDRDLFRPGDECFVVGWGYTDPLTYFNSKHPSVLQEAQLPILSPKECRNAYGDLYTEKMVCAGHMLGEQRSDACKGDSGGPLMCRDKGGQWVVWGIVSWGHNYFCNGSPDKPIPTVYTRVEEYVPWIKRRLRLEQC